MASFRKCERVALSGLELGLCCSFSIFCCFDKNICNEKNHRGLSLTYSSQEGHELIKQKHEYRKCRIVVNTVRVNEKVHTFNNYVYSRTQSESSSKLILRSSRPRSPASLSTHSHVHFFHNDFTTRTVMIFQTHSLFSACKHYD